MKNLLKTGLALVTGATVGLLFAKKSGKQLRTKLSKSETPFKDLVEEFKGVAQNTKEFAADKENVEKLKKASKDIAKNAEEKLDGFINKAKEKIENLKEDAQEVIDEMKEDAQELKAKAEEKIETAKTKAKSTAKKFKNKLEK